jgi:hypothetical protein
MKHIATISRKPVHAQQFDLWCFIKNLLSGMDLISAIRQCKYLAL